MKWIECAVYTVDAGIEPVCAALSGIGIDQVAIEESRERAMAFLNERAVYWDYADADRVGTDTPCVKAYIEKNESELRILDEIKAAVARLRTEDFGVDIGPLTIVMTEADDADWADNWKQYYKPIPIGDRLLVTPSWEPIPQGNTRAVLKLDPGVAFGTGAHHTTRMCLEFLEQTVKQGDRVLDLGCGSGILSIAAVLLGARDAVAVDIDPIAEHIAYENAALNGISADGYHVEIGDILTDGLMRERILGEYDIVLANIVAGVILALAPYARTVVKKGAPFIVSGIIDEREQEVVEGLIAAGFTIDAVHRSEGWVGILARG